jgi:uncharacterized protein (DUF433 family)
MANPEILGGKPCIRGTRISVELILEWLASGATQQEILDTYPHLSSESVSAAIHYAAQSLRRDVVWEVTVALR